MNTPTEIINPWGDRQDRCWCPFCEKDNQAVKVTAFWMAPNGVIVCWYGFCGPCYKKTRRLSIAGQSKIVEGVQTALVNRYPELLKLLPDEY